MPATATVISASTAVLAPRRRAKWTRSLGRMAETVLSFQALVTVCVLTLIAVAIPRSMADPDIWWHLRNAQTMLAQHIFVRHDTFSFTAQGSAWIDHEWLAELPFYLGWKLAGANGIYLVTITMVETIFAGVLLLCWRASRSLLTASLATIIAALFSTISFGPRTLLFGWLCLIVELLVLDLYERRPAVIAVLPVLFGIWINLHGSWVIGLTVLAVHTVSGHLRIPAEWIEPAALRGRQTRNLVFAWLGILSALFCNPWGWRLVAYPFNLAFRQTLNIASVQEWQSLDLHSFRGKVLVAVLVLLVGRQLCKPRRWQLTELALLSIGLWSAFNYSRFLFLLALLAAPIAARSFPGRTSSKPIAERPFFNGALMALVVVLLVAALGKNCREEDKAMQQFPTEALPALAHLDVHCRLFNEFLWGGYLEWYSPERPVFIDSRVDIFEYSGTFKDYLDIVRIKNTLNLLDYHKIDAVFFEKDTPLIYLLTHAGSWKTTYDDGRQVLLERLVPLGSRPSSMERASAADIHPVSQFVSSMGPQR